LNLKDTTESLILRNKDSIQIQFVFVVDKNEYSEDIRKIFHSIRATNLILEILHNNLSWAENSNLIMEKYSTDFKYLLFSHDDLKIETENYLDTSIEYIESLDFPVGWVTFTSTGYYGEKTPISNSVRTGFFQDRFNFPYVFESASFKNQRTSTILLPENPVYCHAPYSHLNLISSKSLGKIGEFPKWTEYTILLDEDQGLRALFNNLPNIWLPNVKYQHPLRADLRKIIGVRFEHEAHEKFRKKWGLSDLPYNVRDVEFALNNYEELFTWTVGRNSFDWSYVK
jgi:hypothetical protein